MNVNFIYKKQYFYNTEVGPSGCYDAGEEHSGLIL